MLELFRSTSKCQGVVEPSALYLRLPL